jgi:hypothetical protein
MSETGTNDSERRRYDRSHGVPLRRRQHGYLADTLLERRGSHRPGFDVAAELERYFDLYPTREAQLALLRAWLDAAENNADGGDLNYSAVIERAIAVMQEAANTETAIAMLQRRDAPHFK